jgi:hypothetical protein
VAADGSKNQTTGGGGQGPGHGPGQPGSGPSVRLRAEEVVERGLRLYAHGDLVGALAEWRRALEMDAGNRRGRDYLDYVEDHFDVLSERFRAARERTGADLQPLDLAIEIEADDPMEEMDPYESLELASPPGLAGAAAAGGDEDLGESTSPAPDAPHLNRASAGGKQGAGRRPWSRRGPRDLDEHWPMDDSWPSALRNDTLEMAVDPSILDDLEELDDLGALVPDIDADADDDDDAVAGAAADGDADVDAGVDGDADAAADVEAEEESGGDADAAGEEDGAADDAKGADGDLMDGVDGLLEGLDRDLAAGVQTIDEVLEAVDAPEDDGEDEDAAPEEETLPARQSRSGPYVQVLGAPTAEGSRPAGGPELASGAGRAGRPRARDDSWADGTPPAEPVELDGERAGEMPAMVPEELREVRVTFRRSTRTSESPPENGAAPVHAPPEVVEVDEVGMPMDAQPTDADVEAYLARAELGGDDGDPDDGDVDEEELTIERDGVSARETDESWRRRTATRNPPPRTPTENDRTTTELQGQRRQLSHRSISIDLVSADLQAELDAAMAAAESTGDEHLRERVAWLLDRAREENGAGRYPNAVVAVDLALEENPESAMAQKLIHSNRDLLFEIFGNYLGDTRAVPRLALPMSSIPLSDLDHRAAFLLSRVDGMLSLEDVLDVSGMARLEAFRHLSRLLLRGILELRP